MFTVVVQELGSNVLLPLDSADIRSRSLFDMPLLSTLHLEHLASQASPMYSDVTRCLFVPLRRSLSIRQGQYTPLQQFLDPASTLNVEHPIPPNELHAVAIVGRIHCKSKKGALLSVS